MYPAQAVPLSVRLVIIVHCNTRREQSGANESCLANLLRIANTELSMLSPMHLASRQDLSDVYIQG